MRLGFNSAKLTERCRNSLAPAWMMAKSSSLELSGAKGANSHQPSGNGLGKPITTQPFQP
jgi:hypothetical protein